MSNLENNNEEENKAKKVLHIKRRPEYSLQDILNRLFDHMWIGYYE